jgi:hypothetical protein
VLRKVARGLRYRTLPGLVGRTVAIVDLRAVEEAIFLTLGPDLPEGCRLAGPELPFREEAVAKYGILDLRFSVPAGLLDDEPPGGLRLLRELGFLPGVQTAPWPRTDDDPTCLETLRDEIAQGNDFLLLFLEGDRPAGPARGSAPDGTASLRVPPGYLPRPFRVADACLANASSVWIWKHFYL